MRCSICKQAELRDGQVTVKLERGRTTVIFKNVPAQICPNCGEEYVDAAITANLLESAAEEPEDGCDVAVRHYASHR